MWILGDCFIHGCVFCYWMCRLHVLAIPFRMSFFSSQFLALSLWIFNLSLHVGDKFFQSDDKWNCQLVIGLK